MEHIVNYNVVDVPSAWIDDIIFQQGFRYRAKCPIKENSRKDIIQYFSGETTYEINNQNIIETNTFRIDLNEIFITISAVSNEVCFKVINDLKQYIEFETGENICVIYFYDTPQGLHNISVYIDIKQFTTIYDELYPEINSTQLVTSFNQSRDPILILYGLPGTGKTTFIKKLIQSQKYKKIAYIKDKSTLLTTSLWPQLIENKFQLIVLDDLDSMLEPRENKQDSSEFVNNLLSFSNGIFNHTTKIIITTNVKLERIDPAIVRPGRCFDFLVLNPLSFADAKIFWIDVLRASPEVFDSLYKKQEPITQASLMSNHLLYQNSQAKRNYIKNGRPDHYTVEEKLLNMGIQVGEVKKKTGFKL